MTVLWTSFRRSRWGVLLVFALAGTTLVQSGPIRLLVQQVRPGAGEHVCHHCANGVCPRNPEAPRTGVHLDSGATDTEGATLQSCDRDSSEALAPMSEPKWESFETVDAPAPSRTDADDFHLSSSLTSQRLGDEVFRPPRTTPPVRLT